MTNEEKLQDITQKIIDLTKDESLVDIGYSCMMVSAGAAIQDGIGLEAFLQVATSEYLNMYSAYKEALAKTAN